MVKGLVADRICSSGNRRVLPARDGGSGTGVALGTVRPGGARWRGVMTAGAIGLLLGCTAPPAMTETALPKAVGLPNPASVHCLEMGGTLHMERSENGGEFGVCDLPGGRRCEEWALFRGECGKAPPTRETPSPAAPERAPSGPN